MKRFLDHLRPQVTSILSIFVFLAQGASFAEEPLSPLILDMVHHNPGGSRYHSTYEDPSTIKRMGYNGKIYFLFDSPTLATTWESVSPDILPQGSKDRKWVEQKAASIRAQQEACKKEGLSVFAMADMVLFPKRLIEQFNLDKTFGDASDPQTQKFLRIQISEVFSQFPLTDGIVVRIGETYLHDAPYHEGRIHNKNSSEQTIIPLLQLLRDEICVKRNKTLIFRTWLSFDKDAARYQKINDAIEPHPDLIFSIKHCEGDFHRTNPFSKVIGQGRHRQLIEVQCAREYEGKGAYPNYIANGVIEGFEEHLDRPKEQITSIRDFVETKPELFAGIWTWTRGGGWNGPFIKNELWCDLNAWVMAQWAHDTTQSEASLCHRYAKERLSLKGDDIEAFRRICLLSADAVIRGRNSTHGDMNPWWTRDQGIGWPEIKDNRARNLKQKDESIQLWQEIVKLTQHIRWADTKTQEHAVGSAYYGLHLYEIYRSLMYLEDAVERKDSESISKWIQAYENAWESYQQLPEKYPNLATLYTRDYTLHIRDHAESKVEKLKAKITEP